MRAQNWSCWIFVLKRRDASILVFTLISLTRLLHALFHSLCTHFRIHSLAISNDSKHSFFCASHSPVELLVKFQSIYIQFHPVVFFYFLYFSSNQNERGEDNAEFRSSEAVNISSWSSSKMATDESSCNFAGSNIRSRSPKSSSSSRMHLGVLREVHRVNPVADIVSGHWWCCKSCLYTYHISGVSIHIHSSKDRVNDLPLVAPASMSSFWVGRWPFTSSFLHYDFGVLWDTLAQLNPFAWCHMLGVLMLWYCWSHKSEYALWALKNILAEL